MKKLRYGLSKALSKPPMVVSTHRHGAVILIYNYFIFIRSGHTKHILLVEDIVNTPLRFIDIAKILKFSVSSLYFCDF